MAHALMVRGRRRGGAVSVNRGVFVPELGLTVVAEDGTPCVPLAEGLKAIYDPREIAKLAVKQTPSKPQAIASRLPQSSVTHETETRYRSPSGREARALAAGKFRPTLPPLPAELPAGVGDYLDSLNRRERRKFAAKARAHVARKRVVEAFTRPDGVEVELDRERGTATLRVTGSEAVAAAYRDALVMGTGILHQNGDDVEHVPFGEPVHFEAPGLGVPLPDDGEPHATLTIGAITREGKP